MRSCKLLIFFLPIKIVLTTLLIIHEGDIKLTVSANKKSYFLLFFLVSLFIERFPLHKYQVPDHDEMLAK